MIIHPKVCLELLSKESLVERYFGVILATIIAVILSNFAKFSDMICGIIWIIIVVLCILLTIWSSVDDMKRYIADFEINNKTD